MNILLVNYEFPPAGGGAGNATYHLAKHLSKESGIKTNLLFGTDPGYGRFPAVEGIKMYPVEYKRKGIHEAGISGIMSFFLKARPLLNEIIVKGGIELVHYFFSMPTAALTLLIHHPIPYIISLRGGDVPGFNIGEFQFMHMLLRPLNMHIWNKAKFVIANSENLRKAAINIKPDIECRVIPNGVDTAFFKPNNKTGNGKSRLKLLTVSRLLIWKGLEYLIEAVRGTDIELTIIGKGKNESKLKEIAGKNVKFLGHIDRIRLPEYYNQADIFILPSLSEGMSNSVLEAMSCGLPVVLTDTGGARSLIEGNGFIVDKHSSGAIRNAIEKYEENRHLIKQHGRISRTIAEGFSWESMTSCYSDIYREVLREVKQ